MTQAPQSAHSILHDALKRATAHCRPGTAHDNLASALSVASKLLTHLLRSGANLYPRVVDAAARYLAPSPFKPPARKPPGERGTPGQHNSRWVLAPRNLRRADRPRYGHRKNPRGRV